MLLSCPEPLSIWGFHIDVSIFHVVYPREQKSMEVKEAEYSVCLLIPCGFLGTVKQDLLRISWLHFALCD